jgi:hypothetical protein
MMPSHDDTSSQSPAEKLNSPQDKATKNVDGENEGPEKSISLTLQTFLSEFGIISSSAVSTTQQQDGSPSVSPVPSHSWRDLIFESSFDLTDERLRYIFDMLDSEETGRISYDSLRHGLDMHSFSEATSHPAQQHHPLYLTQFSFDRLVELLDVDESQDITFAEFSQGLRYLMLRALFPSDTSSTQVQSTIEMLDYDAQHLERRIVVHDNDETDAKDARSKSKTGEAAAAARFLNFSASHAATTVQPISPTDFYFQDRPEWVQTRWINVSGAKSSVTLKRLAVRYMLHPLALEDALSPDQHRPKAEVYSNRK